jgi:hypothetical protein
MLDERKIVMRTIGLALFMICISAAGCTDQVSGGGDGLGEDQQAQEFAACSGVAGTPCAAGFACVDDPNDSCNPKSGASCSEVCVEETANPPQQCGGFANISCPKGLSCADDPTDDCDPWNGGSDCGGVCVDAANAQFCGGIGGLTCAKGYSCVDDPTDDCDPQHGADCSGICVEGTPPPPPPCGGFAGLGCDQGLTCVDDPSDDCDPAQGGADCTGFCVAP